MPIEKSLSWVSSAKQFNDKKGRSSASFFKVCPYVLGAAIREGHSFRDAGMNI
tara:strand:+ start:260 stop:418 length:159 start_codon:yes stop_codon:yes gene_type:complete